MITEFEKRIKLLPAEYIEKMEKFANENNCTFIKGTLFLQKKGSPENDNKAIKKICEKSYHLMKEFNILYPITHVNMEQNISMTVNAISLSHKIENNKKDETINKSEVRNKYIQDKLIEAERKLKQQTEEDFTVIDSGAYYLFYFEGKQISFKKNVNTSVLMSILENPNQNILFSEIANIKDKLIDKQETDTISNIKKQIKELEEEKYYLTKDLSDKAEPPTDVALINDRIEELKNNMYRKTKGKLGTATTENQRISKQIDRGKREIKKVSELLYKYITSNLVNKRASGYVRYGGEKAKIIKKIT